MLHDIYVKRKDFKSYPTGDPAIKNPIQIIFNSI